MIRRPRPGRAAGACALLLALQWAAAQEPPAGDRQALLARREAAQQVFLRLNDEGRHEEAEAVATQVVDLTRQAFGGDSIEMAAPLANLATTQLALGNHEGAMANYGRAVEIIERRDGLGSPRAINPLVGLGEAGARSGDYALARDAFQKALRTNHAQAGFYNTEQLPIMDGLSEAWLGLGKLSEANAQQRAQVAIARRRSAGATPEVVQALFKLARWYNRTGQYVESRESYQQARQLLRDAEPADDGATVDALLGEALTYANEGAAPASATALKRALELLDSRPEPDHARRAEVLVALGDLYTASRQPRAARQRYGQAWQELTGDAQREARRAEYFAAPRLIAAPALPEVVDAGGKSIAASSRAGGSLVRGAVLVSLTVAADGETRNVAVVESDPPGLMDARVTRRLSAAWYRPRLEDGTPVETTGVQFRHEFRYAAPAQPAGDSAGDGDAGGRGGRIDFPGQDDDG